MRVEEQPIIRVEPKDITPKGGGTAQRRIPADTDALHKSRRRQLRDKHIIRKNYQLKTLRMNITQETEIPSITETYWGAFMYENEIHELFGITFKGINIDFKGNLYKKKMKTHSQYHPRTKEAKRNAQTNSHTLRTTTPRTPRTNTLRPCTRGRKVVEVLPSIGYIHKGLENS